MYNEHFGLKEPPFSIAPDPRYLYMSDQHREALAHLVYGFNSDGGFVLLTGEVGTGKTTVCRCLLEKVPENTSIAFILNPKLTVPEILAAICDELRITYPAGNTSVKIFIDAINRYLLGAHARGERTVLIVDEAQNLSTEVLEQLRLLTNLETNQNKLLQIMLIGQPELREKLSRPELRQLSQRIIARYHLGPLSRKDVSEYVTHRLSVAGIGDALFPPSAISRVFRLSGGVPRIINVLCDRALLGTFSQNKNRVAPSTVTKAAREIFGDARPSNIGHFGKAAAWMLSLSLLIAVGVVLAKTYYRGEPRTDTDIPLIAEQPAELDSLSWTAGYPMEESYDMAFHALLDQWGVTGDPDQKGPPCQMAGTLNLECINEQGNLMSLRLANRPAIIEISHDKGSTYYVTLTSLGSSSASVIAGAEAKRVSLQDLESHWTGKYTLLWQRPAQYNGIIQPGQRHALIPWIEQQLARARGELPRQGENTLFDDYLVKKVLAFQRAEGLTPDGIIGPKTLLHLNTATGNNSPVLTESNEET